jgi:hypothetical protein
MPNAMTPQVKLIVGLIAIASVLSMVIPAYGQTEKLNGITTASNQTGLSGQKIQAYDWQRTKNVNVPVEYADKYMRAVQPNVTQPQLQPVPGLRINVTLEGDTDGVYKMIVGKGSCKSYIVHDQIYQYTPGMVISEVDTDTWNQMFELEGGAADIFVYISEFRDPENFACTQGINHVNTLAPEQIRAMMPSETEDRIVQVGERRHMDGTREGGM